MTHNCRDCLYYSEFRLLNISSCDLKPHLTFNDHFPFNSTSCSRFKEINFGKDTSTVRMPRSCKVFNLKTAACK
jgi:hypothetical protein